MRIKGKVFFLESPNGREYCGKETQPYDLNLALNDIAHRRMKGGWLQMIGFLERLNRTLLDELFHKAFEENLKF